MPPSILRDFPGIKNTATVAMANGPSQGPTGRLYPLLARAGGGDGSSENKMSGGEPNAGEAVSTHMPRKGHAEQVLSAVSGCFSSERMAVLDFVRTSLAFRCNIVKVWRPLPAGLWRVLETPGDELRSRRLEQQALACVGLMAVMLIGGFSSIGYRKQVEQTATCFPLLGPSFRLEGGQNADPGWYWAPGQSISLGLWIVVPTLAGWAFVRGIWIPFVAAGRPSQGATMAMARHLSGVYLYVYWMIVVGAGLMPLLILAGPERTETLRWCLRWFLFGGSFFVPAVMYVRLVRNDTSGAVFGRARQAVLTGYLIGCVAIPVAGMAMGSA